MTVINGNKEVLIRVLIAAASFMAGGGGAAMALKGEITDAKLALARQAIEIEYLKDFHQEILFKLDEIHKQVEEHNHPPAVGK